MFPLRTNSFPSSAADLTHLLRESVQRIFITEADPVQIDAESYPRLQRVHLRLDRAKLRPHPSPAPVVRDERTPALSAEELRAEGTQLKIGPATADFHLHAREVEFAQARDARDEIVLIITSVKEGHIEVRTSEADLEAAITAVANCEAGKQGVTIEKVALKLDKRGPRSLGCELRVTARKLFFSTVISIKADVDLDEELNANLSGLACHGEGAIGSLACGVLAPRLEKLNNRSFSLLALPLGGVQLRDVRISTADTVSIRAEFG